MKTRINEHSRSAEWERNHPQFCYECMNDPCGCKPKHTPGPLSFDGFGINLGDKYKSRLCTFLRPNTPRMEADNKHYGPLLAAAPELLEALKDAEARLRSVNTYLADRCLAAIAKAEGKS